VRNEPPFDSANGPNGRPQFFAAAILFAVVCALLLFVGCSTESKHKWLSRFFDGVPAPGATNAPAAVSEDETRPASTNAAAIAIAVKPLVPHTLHPPYHDGNCTECHESKFSQKMKGPMNSVCFACHDDFLGKTKFKHQPAETGDCASCHDPHESPNKKLLVRTGKAMCLECHDDPLAKGKIKHQALESGDCLDCHSPHASNVKGLLKKPLAASCFECHDDFLKTAKVKHAPVENGECMSCHAPHASDHKGLLIKAGSAMCFDCHETADVAKVEAHKVPGSDNCTSCHDPHASAAAKLLKPSAVKSKEAK